MCVIGWTLLKQKSKNLKINLYNFCISCCWRNHYKFDILLFFFKFIIIWTTNEKKIYVNVDNQDDHDDYDLLFQESMKFCE